MKDKLAIIGNGFDISHGLKTGYLDFAKTLPKKNKEDWEKILIESEVHPDTWYSFEDAIDKITANWQNRFFETVAHNDDNFIEEQLLKNIEKVNQLFFKMNSLLFNYLLKEQSKSIAVNEKIKKVLSNDIYAINFNYTKTVENYTKNIYYIHGSLDEGEIILGYKLRVEHTGIMSVATQFDKQKLRERINFRRILIDQGVKGSQLNDMMEEFVPHLERLFSGRGGYVFEYPPMINQEINRFDEKWRISSAHPPLPFNRFVKTPFAKLPFSLKSKASKLRLNQMPSLINEYGEKYNFGLSNIELEIKFEDIKELIILGHSLEADKEIIEDLISQLTNLEMIKLFVYEKEKEEKYLQKKRYLEVISSQNVEILQY